MIPMKHSTIFKSRWMALLWSAGIIWFALDVAGGGDGAAEPGGDNGIAAVSTDVTGAPVTLEETRALAGIIEGQ